jgi:hypothetical protein
MSDDLRNWATLVAAIVAALAACVAAYAPFRIDRIRRREIAAAQANNWVLSLDRQPDDIYQATLTLEKGARNCLIERIEIVKPKKAQISIYGSAWSRAVEPQPEDGGIIAQNDDYNVFYVRFSEAAATSMSRFNAEISLTVISSDSMRSRACFIVRSQPITLASNSKI